MKKAGIDYAGVGVRSSWYGYLFVNGQEVGRYEQQGEGAVTKPYFLDLTEHLQPGRNVLIISTTGDGFSMEGHVRYDNGSAQALLSTPDRWKVQKFAPLTIAPLPPLVSYGLKRDYPSLRLISDVDHVPERGGHRMGEWGTHMAAIGQDHVVYRVPLDPIKRFGGFTSFCFSGPDIGGPGNIKEIETVKRTGSNSYRPQHKRSDAAAMRVVDWCWEQGIQNMFNVDGSYAAEDTIFHHYRKLAEQCKDYPPEAVAYDFINEPANMEPDFCNPRVKKLTEIIREIDKTHLIYVETPHSFASISQFVNLEPTGDELTCYSFHDYDYRLPRRWPHRDLDIRNILAQWIPAFKYSIDHGRPIHLGEFGGFEQTRQNIYSNHCAITLLSDMFRIFDQFGWHWNYYANRGVVRRRADGSLQESLVQEAYRRCFAKGTFNANRDFPHFDFKSHPW